MKDNLEQILGETILRMSDALGEPGAITLPLAERLEWLDDLMMVTNEVIARRDPMSGFAGSPMPKYILSNRPAEEKHG